MIWFWAVAVLMVLIAVALLLVPLLRAQRKSGGKSILAPASVMLIVPVSVGLYFAVTTFDADLASQVRPNEIAMLEQLAERLADNPDDPDSWVLLGRSYLQLGDYQSARLALEEAWARVETPDATLKLAYAQSVFLTQRGPGDLILADTLAAELLAESPTNQGALLIGGLVSSARGDVAVASDRLTRLLATNPPPEIADIVRNQLVSLTGSAPGMVAPAETTEGPVITVDVSLADDVSLDRFGPEARLYLIARSSDMPMPIAAVPYPLSALPGTFTISDANRIQGMAVNRSLTQYDQVTVIARISQSGNATQQSGDVYAESTVDLTTDAPAISLTIDQIVP